MYAPCFSLIQAKGDFLDYTLSDRLQFVLIVAHTNRNIDTIDADTDFVSVPRIYKKIWGKIVSVCSIKQIAECQILHGEDMTADLKHHIFNFGVPHTIRQSECLFSFKIIR